MTKWEETPKQGRPTFGDEPTITKSISLDKEVLEIVDQKALEEGKSRSRIINKALRSYYLIG